MIVVVTALTIVVAVLTVLVAGLLRSHAVTSTCRRRRWCPRGAQRRTSAASGRVAMRSRSV